MHGLFDFSSCIISSCFKMSKCKTYNLLVFSLGAGWAYENPINPINEPSLTIIIIVICTSFSPWWKLGGKWFLGSFIKQCQLNMSIKLFGFYFTGWLGSVSMGVSLFFSPLWVSVCKRKSTRLSAVFGGLVGSLGCLFTSFALQFHQICISYGAFIGKKLKIHPSLVKWKNIANLTCVKMF